jgi:hypothetical protein
MKSRRADGALGLRAIEFGTDSGAPTLIANLKKEFSVDDLRRASHMCHKRACSATA